MDLGWVTSPFKKRKTYKLLYKKITPAVNGDKVNKTIKTLNILTSNIQQIKQPTNSQ